MPKKMATVDGQFSDDEASGQVGPAFFLFVRIKPRADKLAQAEAQLQLMRAAAQRELGCVFMHLVQGTEDAPDTWTMIEKFTSRSAWAEHMASEHNQRGNADLEPLLREPSTLAFYLEK